MSSQILTLLIICAVLMAVGIVLLLVAVGALVVILRRGGEDEYAEPSTEFAKERIQSRLPVADPNTLPGPPSLPPGLQGMPIGEPEDEGMKTEVFTRGSLNMDWDELDGEGEATEVFRADLHGLAPDDMGFELE